MKKKVLLILGGRSGEHAVSVRSARSIEAAIDPELYNIHCLGISPTGDWHYGPSVDSITANNQVLSPSEAVFLPGRSDGTSLVIDASDGLESIKSDIIFPIIHGTFGEDGKLQGLLEMANAAYVGSGVLGSAISMDKVIQKTLCAFHSIPQATFIGVTRTEWEETQNEVMTKLASLKLPLFVKPANLGSSVGITKVKTSETLEKAIHEAFLYDHKIVVEEGISDMVEVEVSVLGNSAPVASVCGTLRPRAEFYDYKTKYLTDDVEKEIPAQIPTDISDKIRAIAIETFKILNCAGLARIDFFYQPSSNSVFLNELNTLPGFTSTSMYPVLWEASGVSYSEVISKLLALAEENWQAKQGLRYDVDEKTL
ncbi:MAG: D-alanine--D-alanine ligase [bacterium]|nr:D-alanine--D-alanine ligase [bacterium]